MANKMPLEDRFCTLEQAKELAEIFKRLKMEEPRSLWVWQLIGDPVLETETWKIVLRKDVENISCICLPAYSFAELWGLLPSSIERDWHLSMGKGYVQYKHYSNDYFNKNNKYHKLDKYIKNAVPAHACSALAIQGLKKGWIQPEDFHY